MGIQLHDVISVTRKQRVGEDGNTKGHSYMCNSKTGVVVEVNDTEGEEMFSIKTADSAIETYEKYDSEYTYEIARASDIDYADQIRVVIKNRTRDMVSAQQDVIEAEEWLDTFTNSLSFIGQLVRFAKQMAR